jgi:hypothetical protein
VTLGRRGRESPTARGDARDDWQIVEVEELPPQRVLARGATRPRIGAILAASGAVLILAGGLGVLGGRAAPEPTDASAIDPSQRPTSTPSGDVAEPLVTPNLPCPALGDSAIPGMVLQVGGLTAPGDVEVLKWLGEPGTSAAPPKAPGPPTTDRIEIRPDLTSVLYTAGDACAVAWQIALADGDVSVPLDTVGVPGGATVVAQQNRFELPLWQHRGHDYDLDVVLAYPNVVVHARWPIRILPFQPPTTLLLSGNRSIPVSPGCNLLLSFGGGGVERVYPCGFDVVSAPPVTGVAPGTPLVFSYSDGWNIEPGGVVCGELTGTQFEEDPEAACGLDEPVLDPSAPFRAPSRPGTWTLAISACAIQSLADVYNEVCGTWYTTLRVRS